MPLAPTPSVGTAKAVVSQSASSFFLSNSPSTTEKPHNISDLSEGNMAFRIEKLGEQEPREGEGPPPVSRALVEHIEEKFPDKCPEGTDPHLWSLKQGQLEVVKYLRRIYKRQKEG